MEKISSGSMVCEHAPVCRTDIPTRSLAVLSSLLSFLACSLVARHVPRPRPSHTLTRTHQHTQFGHGAAPPPFFSCESLSMPFLMNSVYLLLLFFLIVHSMSRVFLLGPRFWQLNCIFLDAKSAHGRLGLLVSSLASIQELLLSGLKNRNFARDVRCVDSSCNMSA